MRIEPLNAEDIQVFLSKHRVAGQKILAGLQDVYPELSAVFSTDIGRELLKEDIKRLESLFTLVYQEKANEGQLAEFRYLRDERIPRLIGKLSQYLAKVQQIRQK